MYIYANSKVWVFSSAQSQIPSRGWGQKQDKITTKDMKCNDLTVTFSADLASGVHLHPSTEEEDHILQTALPTCPDQSLEQLIQRLV